MSKANGLAVNEMNGLTAKRSNFQFHEKELPINCSYYAMRIWVPAIVSGLPLPTIGRDPSLSAHRLWRNPHLQRESDRDRLQI